MKGNVFRRNISKDQSRDTGMAMVLLFLVVTALRKKEGYLFIATALHVTNMIVPQIYRPLAVVWLSLSDLLGAIVSKILLAIVFLVVVTPMGVIRRLFGKDLLRLRTFKVSKESVLLERNHAFVGCDLERPY